MPTGAGGVRLAAYHATVLELAQTSCQDVARGTGAALHLGEPVVAIRQLPKDQQGPAVADEIEGLGDGATQDRGLRLCHDPSVPHRFDIQTDHAYTRQSWIFQPLPERSKAMSASAAAIALDEGVGAGRHRRSARFGYWLAAAIIGLGLFASGAPSPLYAIYRHLWGFSPLVLTMVYATYAVGVLATLLLAGRVSDDVGRRPVLLGALAALILASIAFMLASSVAWLFVARGLQGLATGALLSAASAALLDLHSRRDAAAVGLTNGVASTGGLGLGVLVSATLVEFAPSPRVLPFAFQLGLAAIAFLGVLLMPEPVAHRSRLRLTPQRPSLPRSVRRPFRLAALGVLSSWTIAGLFFSLGPQLAVALFHTSDHLVGGLSVFILPASGAVSQLLFGRTAPWRGAAGGSIALAVGMVMIVFAALIDSTALYVLGAVLGGGGFGIAFLGSLRALTAVIPQEHRAAVMSAFYIVAYASISVPAVLAGAMVTPLGLRTTFEIFGSIVAALALVVAREAWRTRPVVRVAVEASRA
jgi:MFS family permease